MLQSILRCVVTDITRMQTTVIPIAIVSDTEIYCVMSDMTSSEMRLLLEIIFTEPFSSSSIVLFSRYLFFEGIQNITMATGFASLNETLQFATFRLRLFSVF